jgi:hypothetical protein
MIGKDAVLASMFFNNRADITTTATTSVNNSKIPGGRNSMLTLENIKMHDKQIMETNNKFYPRINKLVDMANKRYAKGVDVGNRGKFGPSTNFTNTFSVFDALYELESFNQLPSVKGPKSDFQDTQEDEALRRQVLTQDDFRDALLQKML